jgi:hypothetical protein
MGERGVRIIPKSRYENTIVCPECHAEYRKNTEWVRGCYEGTSSSFVASMIVPHGHCPVCLKDCKL